MILKNLKNFSSILILFLVYYICSLVLTAKYLCECLSCDYIWYALCITFGFLVPLAIIFFVTAAQNSSLKHFLPVIYLGGITYNLHFGRLWLLGSILIAFIILDRVNLSKDNVAKSTIAILLAVLAIMLFPFVTFSKIRGDSIPIALLAALILYLINKKFSTRSQHPSYLSLLVISIAILALFRILVEEILMLLYYLLAPFINTFLFIVLNKESKLIPLELGYKGILKILCISIAFYIPYGISFLIGLFMVMAY